MHRRKAEVPSYVLPRARASRERKQQQMAATSSRRRARGKLTHLRRLGEPNGAYREEAAAPPLRGISLLIASLVHRMAAPAPSQPPLSAAAPSCRLKCSVSPQDMLPCC
jgi:hypothetical protein